MKELNNKIKAVLALLFVGALPILAFGSSSNNGIVPCGTSLNTDPCDWAHLILLVNNIIYFLLFDLSMPIAAVAFMWAGFLYMTSAGDAGKVKKAHAIFKNVLIGMFFAFGAWLIVVGILKGLGVNPSFYNTVIG